jgi:hypothetical protein
MLLESFDRRGVERAGPRLTRHAEQRCIERGISLQEVGQVMAEPEVSRPSHRDGFIVLWRDGVKLVAGGGMIVTVARTAVPTTLHAPSTRRRTELDCRPAAWLR